jgi:signal transduction histidine kinase
MRRFERIAAKGSFDATQLGELRQSVHESSDLILRNLQRADRLIKSFKHVAVDQTSEEKRVLDLRECLNDILVTLGPTLKKTPHRIALECPPNLIVTTAPGALHQIITNLVMNSLAHGFVAGQSGNIDIKAERREGDVVLDYRDDGQGMEDAVRERVFEPFVTTKRGRGGSGLGGFIIYSLVTQGLQGAIRCDSAPGRGVHFEIKLPSSNSG